MATRACALWKGIYAKPVPWKICMFWIAAPYARRSSNSMVLEYISATSPQSAEWNKWESISISKAAVPRVRSAGANRLDVLVLVRIGVENRVVVDAGYNLAGHIGDIAVHFLGIHQYDEVVPLHVCNFPFGVHGNPEGVQHFLDADPVNPPVIA